MKNIRATDCWLSKFKDFLSKIKDKLAFIRRGIITFIYNIRLLNIEFE